MERVADKLKDLLDKSYSPFHVVLNMENELLNKGFIKLNMDYFTRSSETCSRIH